MFSVLQVSVALGCASRGRTIAFASTFAAFLTRAFDQIRIGGLSESNINIIGSHCGVSVGKGFNAIILIAFLLHRER